MTTIINEQTVAAFLTHHIEHHHKTQREIALELGYRNPNIITMFKQGLTRLPLDKIGSLAKVLEIDSGALFYLAMREYMPSTFEALRPIMQGWELSDEEAKLVSNFRLEKVNLTHNLH